MLDLLITNAGLADGRTHIDIAIENGRIVAVADPRRGGAAGGY